MDKFFHKINFNILSILFSALIFRLFLANFGTLDLDHGTFISWGNQLASFGFKSFYTGWSDYFPGYLYILFLVSKLNLLLPELQTILFKLPAILSDILTGYLIYKIAFKLKDQKTALFLSTIYIFNPAIFSNSTLWGQVDSLTALFSLFAIYMFSKNILLSAVSLAIGTLIKPQAAFILPAILYLFIVHKKSFYELILFAITGLLVFVLGFVPFNNQDNLLQFILSRFEVSANQYPYGSINAFSFWALFGFWKPDDITLNIGLVVSFLLMLLSTIFVFIKRPKAGEYLLAGISFLITFMFLTRIHERHLLPALAPLLVSFIANPSLIIVYIGLSFTYVSNLAYAYYWIVDNYKEIFNPTLVKIFVFTNLALLVTTFVSLFKKLSFKIQLGISKHKETVSSFITKDLSKKAGNLILLLILLFSLLTRVINLGSPKEMYFDEIYHSFTATLILHNDPKAWEWWNPHPEGFAYEWTHPPISKLGMVVGMLIFGENSFGWRVPQAILGTLSVLLIYLLAYQMFKDRKVGLLSAFIFSLDGLPLVLSRMGMNDSYVLFFSLLSILLFLKDKNILSSLSLGLAVASKWSAIYILPILFVSHFVFKKKLKLSYLGFLAIPIVVYVLSYSVMFTTGHTWQEFVEVQKQMWWYHTNLDAEHPYTSPAWTWPILLRPIYLYDGQTIDNLVARIYAFGNPFVFWFGLFSIILSIFISKQEKQKKLGFVVFSYLVFFLPWIASPRIMFLYHYLPSIPFMAIASGFILRRFPRITKFVLVLCALSFIYFYPHWTGMRVPVWLDESYYWLSSWR